MRESLSLNGRTLYYQAYLNAFVERLFYLQLQSEVREVEKPGFGGRTGQKVVLGTMAQFTALRHQESRASSSEAPGVKCLVSGFGENNRDTVKCLFLCLLNRRWPAHARVAGPPHIGAYVSITFPLKTGFPSLWFSCYFNLVNSCTSTNFQTGY